MASSALPSSPSPAETEWRAFWRQVAAVRRAGDPAAWRQPFGHQIVTADEVFHWLLAADQQERRPSLHLYGHDGVAPPAGWHTPARDDGCMAGYLARLRAQLGDCSVRVADFQAADPDAWRRAQLVLRSLYDEIGLPAGGASIEVCAGSSGGRAGVHKGDRDLLTFVVEGQCRFRLWPYETFADRLDVGAGRQVRAHTLAELDWTQHVDSSYVVEGKPGDALFWPAEWWYLPEPDGAHCTSVTVGMMRGVSTWSLVEQAAQAVLGGGPTQLPVPNAEGRGEGSIRAAVQLLDNVFGRAELRERLEERVLAFASAFGCAAVPSPLVDPALPEGPLYAPVAGSIAWSVRGSDVVWAVGGVAFRHPAQPAIVALLERAARGTAFTAARLVDELANEEVDAGALQYILSLLYAHHALIALP